MTKRHMISESNAKIFRMEYEAGSTLQELVNKYGHDRSTMSRAIMRVGGTMRSRAQAQERNTTIPRDEWPIILKRYETGETLREIADTYSTSFHNIRAYILRSGGTMRSSGGKPRKLRAKACYHCQHKKSQGLISWINS
jgi:Mor family transcriptional regulator